MAENDANQNNNNQTGDKTVPKDAFDTVKAQKIELENQLNSMKGELDKIKTAQEAADKKKLEDQKQFEALYSQEKTRREELEGSLKQTRIRSAFEKEAAANKIVDSDAAYRLADLSKITVDGDNVVGVAEAVKAIAESKPYLIAQDGNPPVKIGNQASGGSSDDKGGALYTPEQLAQIAKADPEGFVRDRDKYLPSMKKNGMVSLLG